jgi:hypothetical protein
MNSLYRVDGIAQQGFFKSVYMSKETDFSSGNIVLTDVNKSMELAVVIYISCNVIGKI